MFATAANLVGWCGLKPRNDVSNGRYKSRKVTHGNRYLRAVLYSGHPPFYNNVICGFFRNFAV